MTLLDHVSVYSYVLLVAVVGFLFVPDPTGILPTLVTLTGVAVGGLATVLSDPTADRFASAVGTTAALFALLWAVTWALGDGRPLAYYAFQTGALLVVPAGYLLAPLSLDGLRRVGLVDGV